MYFLSKKIYLKLSKESIKNNKIQYEVKIISISYGYSLNCEETMEEIEKMISIAAEYVSRLWHCVGT